VRAPPFAKFSLLARTVRTFEQSRLDPPRPNEYPIPQRIRSCGAVSLMFFPPGGEHGETCADTRSRRINTRESQQVTSYTRRAFLRRAAFRIAGTHGLISRRALRDNVGLGRPTYFIASASRYTGRFSPAGRQVYTGSASGEPPLEYPMNVYDLINALSPRCLSARLASNRSRTHASARSRAP